MTYPVPGEDSHGSSSRGHGSLMDDVQKMMTAIDRRFDITFEFIQSSMSQRFADADLRYQQRFDAQTKALDAALAAAKEAVATALIAAEKAVDKANAANEKRFDGVNEFRQTLTDQTHTYMPRSEAESRISAVSEKVDDLKNLVGAMRGHGAGLRDGWGYLIGAVGLFGALLALVFR